MYIFYRYSLHGVSKVTTHRINWGNLFWFYFWFVTVLSQAPLYSGQHKTAYIHKLFLYYYYYYYWLVISKKICLVRMKETMGSYVWNTLYYKQIVRWYARKILNSLVKFVVNRENHLMCVEWWLVMILLVSFLNLQIVSVYLSIMGLLYPLIYSTISPQICLYYRRVKKTVCGTALLFLPQGNIHIICK